MDKPHPLRIWFDRHQVTKLVLYYAVLGAAVAILYQLRPNLPGVFEPKTFVPTSGLKDALVSGEISLSPLSVAGEAALMMLGAVLLMLPVAWAHILTRSRKGFSQSMVQTLIFLPLVVAGTLILVQHSIALAFGLGGVVGAVSFRNRLADPKDAIYIFVAIAVGLAVGFQVMAVAAVISIFFNLVVLLAWRFDFGRMPATLEAGIAQRRFERVRAAAPMPTDFVELMDKQLLRSMTPDQLQAISQRAAARGRKAAEALDLGGGEAGGGGAAGEAEEKKPKFDSTLRVTMQPDDAAAVRQAVEQVLEGQTKRWEFERAGAGDSGRAMAQYKVRFKKSIPSTLVVESMRRSVLPRVVTIDVRDA